MKKLLILALLPMGFAPQEVKEGAELVVHEWGTFTTVAGADGVSLEWRPLAGPSDLPSFVYQIGGTPKGLRHGAACKTCGHLRCGCGTRCTPKCGGCKTCMVANVRMETPVLYFYSDRETTVSVKVDFPKGRITEWYPQARAVGSGIDWGGIRVLPGADVAFPRETEDSHYYPARETDAAPVRACGGAEAEHEKFLFYRGAGTFDLPVRVALEGDRTRIRSEAGLAWAILFENRGGAIGYRVLREVKDVTTEVAEKCGTVEQLAEELVGLLTTEGLFEKEARAMVRTWRDSWFEEGRRVFYSVPREATDTVLPLTIEPRPKALVRVLVGRVEILTPEMEQAIREAVEKLGSESVEIRESATVKLAKYGRFAEPLLKRALAKTEDPEVRTRIQYLLGEK